MQNSGNSGPSLEPKLSHYASQAEMLLSRTIDVEGIALDGFGYTVTVTAGGSKIKQRRLSKSWRKGSADVEDGQVSVSRSGFVEQGLKIGTVGIVERVSLELRESFEATRPDGMTRGRDRSVM